MSFASEVRWYYLEICPFHLHFAVYIERVHRPGNKAILVHCIELPELSINKARMLSAYNITSQFIYIYIYIYIF